MPFKIFAISMIILCGIYDVVYASGSIDSPECHFVGEVVDVTNYQAAGQGMFEGEIASFTDVSVLISQGATAEATDDSLSKSCDIAVGEIRVFQLPMGKHIGDAPAKGSCVSGRSVFGHPYADREGCCHWLKVKEILSDMRCSHHTQ